jgi:hypothetical protein
VGVGRRAEGWRCGCGKPLWALGHGSLPCGMRPNAPPRRPAPPPPAPLPARTPSSQLPAPSSHNKNLIRAVQVQSSPFPFCAASRHRQQAPRAAVGQGVGCVPQGSLPDPAHRGPICEKSRFLDVKPLCSKPKSVTNRRVNEVLKRSPRVTDHGCCS